MAHRFHLVERFDMASRLERVRVPTLILVGDRDVLVSPRSLDQLYQGLPRSRLVKLTGCGHLASVAQPQRVAAEVKRFLL
jgi:pimeloyl-ACP methyl ester carboxylesterase